MKKYPFCAEMIKDEAIFCPHCSKDTTLPQKQAEFNKMVRNSQKIGLVIAIIIVLPFLCEMIRQKTR